MYVTRTTDQFCIHCMMDLDGLCGLVMDQGILNACTRTENGNSASFLDHLDQQKERGIARN